MANVVPGTKWRDRSALGGPIIITVDEVDRSSNTVSGTSSSETAGTTAVWIGSIAEFDNFEPLD
jgi:hypothetical protein